LTGLSNRWGADGEYGTCQFDQAQLTDRFDWHCRKRRRRSSRRLPAAQARVELSAHNSFTQQQGAEGAVPEQTTQPGQPVPADPGDLN